MPRYDAYTSQDFQTKGMARVVIARTDDAGWVQAGVTLLDLYCLGVKDAFATEVSGSDWPDVLNRLIPADERMTLHPACARKLVEGAVAYAEALGFDPHRDYKKARRVFGSVDAKACPETYAYGKDGKPLYVAGPNDDMERIDRILLRLKTRLGPQGFHYVVPVEGLDPSLPPRERIRDFFFDRPRGAASFDALEGFLTALHVCPVEIPQNEWREEIWADEAPKDYGYLEVLETEKAILAHAEELRGHLQMAREAGAPEAAMILDDELPSDADPIDAEELRARAIDWSGGFLRQMDLWPAPWQAAEARADLRPIFASLREIAALPESAPAGFGAADANTLQERLADIVLALHAALHPFPPSKNP